MESACSGCAAQSVAESSPEANGCDAFDDDDAFAVLSVAELGFDELNSPVATLSNIGFVLG